MTSSASDPPFAISESWERLNFDMKIFMNAPVMVMEGRMLEMASESFHERA